MMRLKMTICLLLASIPAFGAEVLKVSDSARVISITHEERRQWAVRDYVCVVQEDREVACGTVAKTGPRGAVVRLENPSPQIAVGDRVKFAPPGRKPAMVLLDSIAPDENTKIQRNSLTAGLGAGKSFFYPLLHYQRLLGDSVSVGLLPLYMGSKTDLTGAAAAAFGGYVTLNYYGSDFFRGVWGQVGFGAIHVTAQTGDSLVGFQRQSGTSMGFLTTFGYRGYWDLGMNIGAAMGGQFLSDPKINLMEISAIGFQPLLMLDVGINF